MSKLGARPPYTRAHDGRVIENPNVEGGGREALKHRPVMVLFYMIGCSHCEANKPKWDELKRKYVHIPATEIESASVKPEDNVSGFPTMKFLPRRGRERVVTGQQESADILAKKLGLRTVNRNSTRRRSRHATRRRV